MGLFVKFLYKVPILMLFLKSKKEFGSCSQSEIGKISITEGKANAHAGMPFFGMPRFAV